MNDRAGPVEGASETRRSRQVPFTVRAAADADVDEIVRVRAEAYARHQAPGALRLRSAEPEDWAGGAVLLMARSKIDASVLGSLRVQTRLHRPLLVEQAMQLPEQIANQQPVELMRGSVRAGVSGRMVSALLAKSSFELCVALGFTHILLTCREPVNAMYRAYQFDELMDGRMVDLPYSPGAKHKVLSLPVGEARHRWQAGNPSMLDFMLQTEHPDIQLDMAVIRARLRDTRD